jgi:glycosyltransferase involved in cell wall biosynthesis
MLINMNVGGTEKALLNMISEIPTNQYDITILMLEEYGGFLSHIPIDVNVKYLKEYKQIKSILNEPLQKVALSFLKSGKLIDAFKIMSLYLISKLMNDRRVIFRYALKDYRKIETEYDLAVAYAGPMDFISYFVINKLNAKKKIQWIHFDITKVGFDNKTATKLYKRFDKVYVVSKEGKNKFTDLFPTLRDRTDTFINIVSPNTITQLANKNAGFEDKFDGIRILTVGRLTKEKGQDLAIRVLAKLKKEGFNVRWYCIGEGNSRRDYEGLIDQLNIKDDFILLGAKTNPYSYMKQCDIYVQPSRHEGYCITLTEAKCFGKPIITTNFTGAYEQIIDNISGLIVDFDEAQMYTAIKKLLNDQNVKSRIEKNLQDIEITPSKEIQKLFTIAN